MRRARVLLPIVVSAAMVAAIVLPLTVASARQPIRSMLGKASSLGANQGKRPGSVSNIECTVHKTGFNVNLDCDDPFPNNEPDIEVDPEDPQHMIASSNDYGTCCDEFYTTFDGGQTWQAGNMSNEGPTRIGSDPVTTFDARTDTAIHASLNFKFSGNKTCDGDLVVSLSTDGGLTWQPPVLVDSGKRCDTSSLGLFNDKEWMVTDNNPSSPFYGRTYLTWTKFLTSHRAYVSSPIFEAHSDDGGRTWSTSQEISGSNPALCTFQTTGPEGRCDENQFSVPTVAPDGTVYVAFENEQNEALWESDHEFDDQYLVVRSSDGGETWSAPSFVTGLEDGFRDYPFNVNGRQTLTNYQVRVNSAGNIVADPNTGTLYLVFSDNRNGTHDTASPVTNTDVFIMSSTDGTTWTPPSLVKASPTDQWFPWVEVNPADGTVGVLFNDRSEAHPSLYNATLAEGAPGAFALSKVSTRASHPRKSVFFQAGVPGCRKCATFHGDYIALSYGSDGHANMTWTDMRDFVPSENAYAQFIYFARK
jgi:hypothetical protein